MRFSPALAEIRFGFGLSPEIPPPDSVAEMLGRLSGPDLMADAYPIAPLADFLPRIREQFLLRRAARKAEDEAERTRLAEEIKTLQRAANTDHLGWSGQTFLRAIRTQDAFRERLVWFWADHFTARGKNNLFLPAALPYVEEAIRPHVAGRFADLLKAAVKSPLMLHFLDQRHSIGPNSTMARDKGNRRGLNENLAREVLELHTLGVGGPYDQTDVRQLAELFTGMTFNLQQGYLFNDKMAEPGPETVLGRRYGGRGGGAGLDRLLDDLALHPATAAHIARKLATHFVSDTPDPALVDRLAARYLDTGGALVEVYAALLDHTASWQVAPGNVKPPADFVVSACRALAPPGLEDRFRNPQHVRKTCLDPMAVMGQNWTRPPGPDGWPEQDAAWITPQGLAVRLVWALEVPQHLLGTLPDPAAFAERTLGPVLTEPVRFAAGAAETRADGIGLVLASPAFQRR
ncbi:DUF1800 domain-containing protein [Ruegeria aquimaris]|uniref:DUF1800 domain-containing protein n=1 Tax=Ruegeria aquimaris TaxID=2984333 RepID=A0ABT3AJ23_9RHOB|nr:DUF1800 domain-containing protein [Ruegeria sp. XHP0148]MCV2888634.1 DUF1800 domain-containing protein [Ruegeria sp. XHP0148]